MPRIFLLKRYPLLRKTDWYHDEQNEKNMVLNERRGSLGKISIENFKKVFQNKRASFKVQNTKRAGNLYMDCLFIYFIFFQIRRGNLQTSQVLFLTPMKIVCFYAGLHLHLFETPTQKYLEQKDLKLSKVFTTAQIAVKSLTVGQV